MKHYFSLLVLWELFMAFASPACSMLPLDAGRALLAANKHLPGSALVTQTTSSYWTALTNSSCHGFLVGIGTQKGGTTALWAYIADNAHPQLRISAVKEVGYWDALHTQYAGCNLGNYLQVLTANQAAPQAGKQQLHQRQQQLPVCAATSTPRSLVDGASLPQQQQQLQSLAGESSTTRLLPSKECRAWKRQLQVHNSPASTSSSGTVKNDIHPLEAAALSRADGINCPQGLYLPGDLPPPRPWWWLWKWPDAPTGASCLKQQQQHQQQQQQQQQEAEGAIGASRYLQQQQQPKQQHYPQAAEAASQDSDDLQHPPPSPPATAAAGPLSAAGSTYSRQGKTLQQAAVAAVAQPSAARAAVRELLRPPQPLYHVDITPRYLIDPAVPWRVRSALPEARIIIILREPVSRAISNFNMWWQKQSHNSNNSNSHKDSAEWASTLAAQVDDEIARLSACYNTVGASPIMQPELASCLGLQHHYSSNYDLALFANRLLAQSIYADGLQRWFELFPAESFMIWVSEDFKADAATHIRELTAWLGLDAAKLNPKMQGGTSSSKLKPVHARHYEGSAHAEVVEKMRRFFEPHNQRLFELLESKGFGSVAARMRQVWSQSGAPKMPKPSR